VGKNFIIEPLIRKIYDKAYQVVMSHELEDPKYNPWVKCKQFIFGEEIWMSDKRDRESTMGKLKALITNEYVTVNEKYRAQEKLKNYAQLYITANQSNALSLDARDRRFFVVHAPEKPLSEEFYAELHKWSHAPDSASMVLSYLLNDVDVSAFNPRANAAFTEDKDEIIEQNKDMIQSYIEIIANNPRAMYENNNILPDQHLYTTSEIFVTINNYARANNMPELRVSHDSLGRYLSNTHVPHRRINLTYGKSKRTVYAILQKKKWKSRSDIEWIAHVRQHNKDYKERKASKIEGKPREKADVIDIITKEKLQS
jgi:hypothetical protein